jgi:hypothetical protein
LYKNRIDFEVTNALLKKHILLEDTKNKGFVINRVKAGLTIMARQIQVLYPLRREADPRTTIMN